MTRGTLRVDLRGGFANQLFQWAVVDGLQKVTGCELMFDARALSRPHERGLQIADLIEANTQVRYPTSVSVFFWRVLRHSPRGVQTHLSEILRPRSRSISSESALAEISTGLVGGLDLTVCGYMQFPKVLVGRRVEIGSRVREAFDIQAPSGEAYAAVHVRRGDYVLDPVVAERFGTPSTDYYLRSVERLSSAHVVLVSDDPKWCSDVLVPLLTAGNSERTLEVRTGSNHFDDFRTLASAQELVLSNSTFSWWAAFVGEQRRVIYPEPWMSDGGSADLPLPDWRPEARSMAADA